ncbi:UNVERIFIED_CONTAM: hypothetical protein FKN15_055159 [Acipenser sinensis]
MAEEKIVLAASKYPEQYNKGHKNYKDTAMWDNMWQSIFSEMDIAVLALPAKVLVRRSDEPDAQDEAGEEKLASSGESHDANTGTHSYQCLVLHFVSRKRTLEKRDSRSSAGCSASFTPAQRSSPSTSGRKGTASSPHGSVPRESGRHTRESSPRRKPTSWSSSSSSASPSPPLRKKKKSRRSKRSMDSGRWKNSGLQ